MARTTSAASHWSVRTFLIWLALACLLPGVLGATLLFVYEYREGRAQFERNTFQTVHDLIQAVDNHLRTSQSIAQTLSTADALANRDFARFHERAREAVALAELGTNVVLRDEAGRQILNTAVEFGEPLIAHAAPDQVRGVFATGKPTVSDVFIGPVLDRTIISIDVPVVLNGKVTYALGIGILPEHFNTLLKRHNLPADWVAGVLDSTGTIVGRSHSPAEFVGQKVSANLLQSMLESSEGSVETTTGDGVAVLSFHSQSPVTNWRVAIGIPRQTLHATFVRTLSMLAMGMAVLFAIGLVLARYMGRRIAHSVAALTAPATALGSGGSVSVPKVHIKEAAEVAVAIGRAGNLLSERATIIRAREEELAEAHRLAKFATWHRDLASGELKTSDSIRLIFGCGIHSFGELRGTLMPVESWERVNAASQEAIRSGTGFDLEERVRGANGGEIWIDFKCEAILNGKGEVTALRGTVQDITERKRADERLRETDEEMRKFKFFSDHANDGHLLFDYFGRIRYANKLACERLGYGEAELLQLNISDIDPSYFGERLQNLFAQSGQTRIAPLEGMHRRKDGSSFPVEVTVTVLELKGEWLMFTTSRAITERKRHEEALHKSERDARLAALQAEAERRRLGVVLEASPVAIIVTDVNGAVVQANAANKRLWGDNYPSSDSIEGYKEWKGWWADGSERHGQPLALHEWAMTRTLHGEEARDIIEIESFSTPPVRRIILVSGAPISDDEGNIIGGVVAQMDITDRVNAEEALRQADRRKDEFLAMLAHELRNPLAPIAAAADLLGFGRLTDVRMKQTSAIIARQVKHMTGLVDDLLDVSRVTRGLVTLKMHKLDAKRIVADALEQARPLIEAREHHLAVHTPHDFAFVLGDQKRLVQVITNLLNNAAKFTRNGGDIVLDMEVGDDHVRIAVSDNGIGMTPDLVTRVFDLFTQAERTPDRSQGGLGIGLALVKSLAELHGGSVHAWSEGIGQGSRFTVCLPRAKEPAALYQIEKNAEICAASGEALKVMVVDDNADAAQMLAMFVEALGHQVFIEHSAAKACELAKELEPNVCLLDIGLPGMDGHELARCLRAHPRTAGAILVAVTGYGREQDRKKAFDAGFDHHFAKPLDTVKLASLLSEIDRFQV